MEEGVTMRNLEAALLALVEAEPVAEVGEGLGAEVWALRFWIRLLVLSLRVVGIGFGAEVAAAETAGDLRRSGRPGSNLICVGERGLALAGGLAEADCRDGE